MSSFPMNAEHSPSQSPSPNFPDLFPLAEKLQETAQALFVFCQSTTSPKSGIADGADQESAESETTPSETRSYQLPGFILTEEQKMLEAYNAESWQEMFNKVYEQLYTTAMLMEHFPAEEEVDGFSIQLIAGNLMVPLNMLNRLCSLIADFRLVHVMKPA